MDNAVTNQIIDIGLIQPHPYNYNRHSEVQIGELRISLCKFGQVRSIVVQEDTTGGYLCVAGHGILEAAKLEEFTTVKADVIPAGWPQVKVLAYLAADNELGRQSNPDLAQLAQLTHTIEQMDVDLARLAAGSAESLGRLTALYNEAEQRRLAEQRAEQATQFLGDDEAHDDKDYNDDDAAYDGTTHSAAARSSSPAHEAPADNPYVNLVFVADRVQRDFVMQTLSHIRDTYELETSVEALVKLCELFEEWEDGPEKAGS